LFLNIYYRDGVEICEHQFLNLVGLNDDGDASRQWRGAKKTILTENGLADVFGGVNPSLTPSVMAARLAVASGKRASFQYDDAKAFIDTARDSGDYTTDGMYFRANFFSV